jgi:hypothetical protein
MNDEKAFLEYTRQKKEVSIAIVKANIESISSNLHAFWINHATLLKNSTTVKSQ